MSTWSGRNLSKVGKEIMIKSVLQSIPSYVMGTTSIVGIRGDRANGDFVLVGGEWTKFGRHLMDVVGAISEAEE